ncbi:MAG: pentapeptide repeat-containing protein [candidate division Zixibacteria bacterium]|nr:pentapeptide repeat-containing protein [candidate division Zixibacteria bacterium]
MGGMIGEQGWRNHGTAVIGEMIGSDNGIGIRGIAPGLQWGYSSIAGTSAANAINSAANALSPGDLILIELHAPGPSFDFESRDDQLGYVAMEFFPAEFVAIQNASLSGIIVCEAAGNGAENFDDPIYSSVFDTTFRNSFAIMCGAGAPPSGTFGTDRSRLGFSNYGERVNLQGAVLTKANLKWVNLGRANLEGATLVRADLSHASLKRANLTNANLERANLTDVGLRLANISGANLRGVRELTQDQLDMACGDEKTVLPSGLTVKPCR